MPDDATPALFMTAEELAEYFQCSVKTIYNLLRNGEIPFLFVDGCFRFESDEIQKWMADKQVKG
jgi:excisionase family DNA binding protein